MSAGSVNCQGCGHPNPPGARFCNQCGRGLAGTSVGPSEGSKPEAPTAVDSERKQVTVLFADVKRSMDLSATVDSEAWWEIMGNLFAVLTNGVQRYGGRIDHFTGDGIMAVFGAPSALEDHAHRACHAALWIQRDLERYTRQLDLERGMSLSVRFGLASGEVVVGRIGGGASPGYAAIGRTAGLAQRMEAAAEPGKVYMTAQTAALVNGSFELSDVGKFKLKGEKLPAQVFELTGPGAVNTSFEASRARGLSQFVGRDREMARLDSALTSAIDGHGCGVVVVGEPGVGKSRLCHEFAQRCKANGVQVWWGRALAHTNTVPFTPVLDLLRGYFGLTADMDPGAIRAQVTGRLAACEAPSPDDLHLVFEFLGVASSDHAGRQMDPDARRRRLLSALDGVITTAGAQGPLVIVVEDLHWIDPASAAFLQYLVSSLDGRQVLLLMTSRPGRGVWPDVETGSEVLGVDPLDGRDGDLLLDDLLGTDRSLDGLSDLVRVRAGGNPLFIEEIIKSLAEGGVLAGRPGAFRLVRSIDRIEIPATIESLLASRIDSLGTSEKRALQAAAVVGRSFTRQLLLRVCELPADELDGVLRALLGTQMIQPDVTSPGEQFAYKHALIEQIAYRSQLASRAAHIHAAVAEAIVELYPASLDEHAALIAYHWERGGERLQAARWSARAAARAGYADPFDAIRHWRKVQELVEGLQPSREQIELALTSRVTQINLAWRLGPLDEETADEFEQHIAAAYREARDLAAGNPALLAPVTALYAVFRGFAGHPDEQLSGGEEAIRLAKEVGDRGLELALSPPLVLGLFHLGRFDACEARASEALSLAGGDPTVGAGITIDCPYARMMMLRA